MLKKLCLFKIIILTLRHNSKVKPRLSGTQNHQRFYLQHSFFVPENVYLIGCMNTADRSLAIVDYALRRRFRFCPIKPEFNEAFINFYELRGTKAMRDKRWNRLERG